MPKDKKQTSSKEEVITIDHEKDSANDQVEVSLDKDSSDANTSQAASTPTSDITSKYSEEIKEINSAYKEEQSEASEANVDNQPDEKDENRGLYSNQFVAPEAKDQALGSNPPATMVETSENQQPTTATNDSLPTKAKTRLPKPLIAAIVLIVVLIVATLLVVFVKA